MENAISTEHKIVLSTIEAIEKYGIRGATNRRIAAMAGVNIAAINYYFRSKEALIKRVMRMTLENAFNYEDFADFPGDTAKERCMAIFTHLIAGGCRYPGLTRAHFHDLLVSGDYESQVVEAISVFASRLAEDLASRGCQLPQAELHLACIQITSAAMFIVLAPELFKTCFGFSACDPEASHTFLQRLVERLL